MAATESGPQTCALAHVLEAHAAVGVEPRTHVARRIDVGIVAHRFIHQRRGGLVGGGMVWLMQGTPWMGVILAMAMIINMFVAAIAGTLIPLSLRALKVDPALASSVFITTLTDVFGFFSFLGLGALFIKYLRVAG